MNPNTSLLPPDMCLPESQPPNAAAQPDAPPQNPPSGLPEALPRHRKIAKLPRPLRDLINSMLDDGCPAREILASLEASTDPRLPYPISEMNISDWRNTGYRRYLLQQERLALIQANREGADGLTEGELTALPEATLQIVANQYYELLADFSPDNLREQLSDDPIKYTRVLNVFARLVREMVYLRKFRDASSKAAAVELKQRDPDRDLSDQELNLLVNRMDRVFKVARPGKPAAHVASDRQPSGATQIAEHQ